MRIGLISFFHDGDCAGHSRAAARERQDYCALHGYACIEHHTRVLGSTLHRAWDKLPILRKHLPEYDWLFWLDADRFIMNFEVKLEQFLDGNTDMILARQCVCLDTGAWLVRNHSRSLNLLDAAAAQTDLAYDPWLDAAAVQRAIAASPELRVRYAPATALSSTVSGYARGDFVLNLAEQNSKSDMVCAAMEQTSLQLEDPEQFGHLFRRLSYERGAIVGVGRGEFAERLLARWSGRHLWLSAPAYAPVQSSADARLDAAIRKLDLAYAEKIFQADERVKIVNDAPASAAPLPEDHALDWIYFNGPASAGELKTWLPKVRNGGIVAGLLAESVQEVPRELQHEPSLQTANWRVTREPALRSFYFVKSPE